MPLDLKDVQCLAGNRYWRKKRTFLWFGFLGAMVASVLLLIGLYYQAGLGSALFPQKTYQSSSGDVVVVESRNVKLNSEVLEDITAEVQGSRIGFLALSCTPMLSYLGVLLWFRAKQNDYKGKVVKSWMATGEVPSPEY